MAFNYNNNNNNSYVGHWYEQTGPDAKYVRDDIYSKFKNNLNKINNKELENILLQNIPDSKTDFGSWRGYATFGIEEKIYNNIKKDIKLLIQKRKVKKAYKTLNNKFLPFIIHKMYEPKGFMTKIISNKTNIGKVKRKLEF